MFMSDILNCSRMRKIGTGLAAAAAIQFAASAPAFAQAAASAFTTGYRYDVMHRLVGTISPDPDGAGPLNYAAVRNTYDAAGRLIKVEKGELSSWQSDSLAPASWGAAFTVLQTIDTVYDSQSRKVKETLSGGGSIQTVTQYSYDGDGNLECTAVRMNPGGTLPASACTQTSPTPADGPDQITRNAYDAADELVQVRKGVGVTGLERAEATYSYTATGKREFTIDGKGNTALFLYDGHDRLFQWVFPSQTSPAAFNDSSQATALNSAGGLNSGDLEQYAYDLNGNRTSLRKRDGSTLNYTYDALNRVTSKLVGANTAASPTNCSAVSFTVLPNLVSLTEGTTAVFTITRRGAASINCSVNYATADSGAVAPGDYTAKSGTLTFGPTQTSQTVSVPTINDALVETSEYFWMNLSSPTGGASLGTPASINVRIDDND